mgnify:CR=1 FL=1|jgi:ankyrin repeat protein
MLIDAGANPRAKNHDNDTAVLLAAQYNATTSLEIVLKAGADPNNGRGGLIGAKRAAEAEGNTKIVEMLENHVTAPFPPRHGLCQPMQAPPATDAAGRTRLTIT